MIELTITVDGRQYKPVIIEGTDSCGQCDITQFCGRHDPYMADICYDYEKMIGPRKAGPSASVTFKKL